MSAWTAISGFLSLVVTIVGAAIKIMRTIDRAESRLESRLVSIELRLAVVEFQNRALLKAFPQVVSSLINTSIVTSEQGAQLISTALENTPIAEILTNPPSQADVDQLRDYVERLKRGESLSAGEARDFYRGSDIVTREYPATEGSWLLFLIAGIVSGGIASKK